MSFKKNKFLTFIGHNKLFIVLAIFTIMPFLLLSFFNNPGSDDFEFSHMTKLLTFEKAQTYRYYNEGGRFFANGILSLNPLVFDNYFLFRIIPFFMIVLFLFSIHF